MDKKPLDPELAVAYLRSLDGNYQTAHMKAEQILLLLVPTDVASAYVEARDNIGFGYS